MTRFRTFSATGKEDKSGKLFIKSKKGRTIDQQITDIAIEEKKIRSELEDNFKNKYLSEFQATIEDDIQTGASITSPSVEEATEYLEKPGEGATSQIAEDEKKEEESRKEMYIEFQSSKFGHDYEGKDASVLFSYLTTLIQQLSDLGLLDSQIKPTSVEIKKISQIKLYFTAEATKEQLELIIFNLDPNLKILDYGEEQMY